MKQLRDEESLPLKLTCIFSSLAILGSLPRSRSVWEGALRDKTQNGCEGVYSLEEDAQT